MRNLLKTSAYKKAFEGNRWISVAAVALVFTVPACYTILKHPTVLEEDYTQAETRRCSDCHDESDLWYFNHPRVPYHSGMGYHDPWVYYYDVPWWYESFWFYNDVNNPETVPLHGRTLRPGDEKNPSSQAPGNNLIQPPDQKSGASTVKTKINTKDESKDEQKSTKEDEKRFVRPAKKKKKDN